MSQTDAANNLFSSGTRTTFNQNENDPTANPFMKVGTLDWDDYRSDDGKLHFKVQWMGGAVENNQLYEWKQTSPPTSRSITGYEGGASAPTGSITNFLGLGADPSGLCVMDGNGGANQYWHCVAAIGCNNANCIPADKSLRANSVQLWISRPGALGPSETIDSQSVISHRNQKLTQFTYNSHDSHTCAHMLHTSQWILQNRRRRVDRPI